MLQMHPKSQTYPMDIYGTSNNINISQRYLIDMKIRLKLRKVGSSFMIAIPSQVIRDLRLKIGDNMLLDVKDSNILIRKEGK
jgi:Antidote-toxin recognition MazE, bacterial antitoxin